MDDGVPRASQYATLSWFRRRKAWNGLKAVWRRSKFLFVLLGAMVLMWIPLALSFSSGPAMARASDATRNGAGAWFGPVLDLALPLYVLLLGSALDSDSIAEYDLLYTSPIRRSVVLRERVRTAFLPIAIASAILGLFGGGLLSRTYGMPYLPEAAGLAILAFPILASAVLGGLHLSLWFAGRSVRSRRRWTEGIGIVVIALVILGLPSLWLRWTLAASDPLPSFVTDIGIAQAQFVLQTGFSAIAGIVAVAPWAALVALVAFTSTHEYGAVPPLARVPKAATQGLQSTPSASETTGFRRRLRAHYRDTGQGGMALRGLISTTTLRSPGPWLAGGFGAMMIFFVFLFGTEATPGDLGFPAIFAIGTGGFATTIVPMFTSFGPGRVVSIEQARLGPFSAPTVFYELVRPTLLIALAVAMLNAAALAVLHVTPFLTLLALFDLLFLGAVTSFGMSLAQMRAASSARPLGTDTASLSPTLSSFLGGVGMLEFFVLFMLPGNGLSAATFELWVAGLLVLNAVLATYAYFLGVRVAGRPSES